MDRAILYVKKQIQTHIEYIAQKSTKTIGEYSYRLARFRSEMFSIFSMGRDSILLEKIANAFRGIHSRTPREDAIKRLKEIDVLLDSYETVEAAEDVEVLRDQVEELQTWRALKNVILQ